jgi:hypothetical protein
MNVLTKSIRCLFAFVVVVTIGCGRDELPRKAIYGNVTCGGQKVVKGSLRFTPMEPTSPLPSTSALIVDGQYRVEQWGGAPIGKYRVQINARGATGRKTQDPISGKTVEETVPVGSPVYGGAQSPLLVEVKTDGDGRLDLEIP